MTWKQHKNRYINYASLQYFPSYRIVCAAQALGEIVMMSKYLVIFSVFFLGICLFAFEIHLNFHHL